MQSFLFLSICPLSTSPFSFSFHIILFSASLFPSFIFAHPQLRFPFFTTATLSSSFPLYFFHFISFSLQHHPFQPTSPSLQPLRFDPPGFSSLLSLCSSHFISLSSQHHPLLPFSSCHPINSPSSNTSFHFIFLPAQSSLLFFSPLYLSIVLFPHRFISSFSPPSIPVFIPHLFALSSQHPPFPLTASFHLIALPASVFSSLTSSPLHLSIFHSHRFANLP